MWERGAVVFCTGRHEAELSIVQLIDGYRATLALQIRLALPERRLYSVELIWSSDEIVLHS